MNYQKFWNDRWAHDGERGGVSPWQKNDAKYEERNQRDHERLAMAFGWTGKERFQNGLEVGAGAGRLTPIMLSACKCLTCVDGSATASGYFKEKFPDIPHHITLIKNLPDILLPGEFDLAMTFTVVQHINDFNEWNQSLRAIQTMLMPSGFYVMHEDISAHLQKRQAAIHMNDRSLEDYEDALNQCNLVDYRVLYFQPTNEYDLVATWRKN